jgi:hypothetical protein
MQNKSMQRLNKFSPIQTVQYVAKSPQRGAIYMERPSDIRISAANEARDMNKEIARM